MEAQVKETALGLEVDLLKTLLPWTQLAQLSSYTLSL